MSDLRSRLRRAAGLVALAAALPLASTATAGAATPKISNYKVTGAFTIWGEPATLPGEPRIACIVTQPAISFTASGFDAVPGGSKLYFQGLWQSKYGFGVPFPTGLLRSSDDQTTFLRDDAFEVDSANALGFLGPRNSVVIADRSGLPNRGRVTIVAWYTQRTKIGSLTLTVPTFLSTKSASFAFVEKPAGACTGAGGVDLFLKA